MLPALISIKLQSFSTILGLFDNHSQLDTYLVTDSMIVSFKHKGLRDFFLKGKTNKINPNHVKKTRLILSVLHNASFVEDCNFPGSDLHKLKGDLMDYWSVKVSGNWRIIFQFIDGNVYLVDYLDYH